MIPAGGCGSTDPVPSTSEEVEGVLPQSRAPTAGRQRVAKPVSKVSSIKKILNKKIKLNSHVKFDEEGEELHIDTPTSDKRYKDIDDDESSDSTVGGIQIREAQRKIQARDKIDRKFERERIRALHRERRLKQKKQEKAVDGDGGGGGSCPTALLATADSDDDGASSDDEEDDTLHGKRKRRREALGGSKRRRNEEQLGTNMDPELADDEHLAKHLLGL